MPDSLHLRVGERRQLRPPPEGVGRWLSSAPAVVSTTDADLVADKPGGLVVAIKAGQARITAFGFDDTTTVFELDIQVEPGHEAAAVRVARNETAALPEVPGVTRWVIANPLVAEVVGDNRVRGLAPGIATALGQGGGAAECVIEVTGSLDVAVGQSVRLAEFFATPVTSWRTSCPSDVAVDATGTVTTGDRPRTVEVSAELATGRTFTFRLRITAAAVPHPLPAITAAGTDAAETVSVPPAAAVSSAVPGSAGPEQLQMVDSLIKAAEGHLAGDDWIQAGAAITAARLAATTDPELSQRVERLAERLRARVSQRAGVMVVEAVRLIMAGDADRASRHLDSARVPKDWVPVIDSVRRLATLSERFASDADEQVRDEIERQLEVVWHASVQRGLVAALPILGELGLGYGDRVVPLMLDALCSPALAGLPVAVTQGLGRSVGIAGTLGVEAVLARLAGETAAPAMVSVLLNLLPDLDLRLQGSCIVKFFRQAGVSSRTRLVERVAALHTNMPGALFDLLAGVLNRMPPDPAFAKAVQARIRAESGSRQDELEAKANVWAAGGHRSAQTVLQRLYDYDAMAFSR